MSLLSFLKPKNQEPIPPGHRCQHRYDNRSRCRLPIDEASEHFCHHHLDSGVLPEPPLTPEQREADLQALYREVMGGAKYLNSATAVNHVLDNLFRLTLLGRIPQRIASKLTTQLRASLTSIRMKRDEYRVSQDDIETLLDDIDSHRESLENETESEPDSCELEPTGINGSSRSSSASNQVSKTNPTSSDQRRPARVAAGLACPEPQRGAQPGFAHAETHSVSSGENRAEAHVAPHSSAAVSNLNNDRGRDSRDPHHPTFSRADSAGDGGPRNDARVAQSANSADASSAEIFRSKDRGASQPRQIELLKAEANRADRDPFFDFLPRADSASDVHTAPPANDPVPQDLPEFSELRAAESRRRVADLVNGVWIGPKPNEINWDQLEQQMALADQINPTLFRRRRSRWWPAT